MDDLTDKIESRPLRAYPRHVAVIGAAGGLGRGILEVCREEGISFTATVRSRPERIGVVPTGSHIAIVTSLADTAALARAFAGTDAVIAALGVTATSIDHAALLSKNFDAVERAMIDANVNRIVIMNTLLSAAPGQRPSLLMRLFSCVPGVMGAGAREQLAVVNALGSGALSSLRWTLVRGGVNKRGEDEPPVASTARRNAPNSWMPVSYRAMGRWMLEEAAKSEFVRMAPLVSLRKRQKAPHETGAVS